MFYLFCYSSFSDFRDLHSFPTRRSSDLLLQQPAGGPTDGLGEPVERGGHHRRGRLTGDIANVRDQDRKSTRLNSSHVAISYAVFCLKKKKLDFISIILGSIQSEIIGTRI